MTAIVIANNHILVDNKLYVPLDWVAYSENGQIGIHHVNNFDKELFKGRVDPSKITLNGVTYLTSTAFVYAFNSLTIAALSYLLTSLKANSDSIPGIKTNSDYPNIPFSARITANTETRVANYAYPGYVTIKALSTNQGNVYIGPTGLGAGSGQLEPGHSAPYEINDLSTLFALNVGAGYIIDVFGVYRQ